MRVTSISRFGGLASAGLLGCALALTAIGPSSAATSQTVSYLGHTFTVPSGWPVIDLSAHPATCVRFNSHAVYLGTASGKERCPDHEFGRTDALQIRPAPAGAAAGATLDGVSHQITSTSGGVSVTATYSASSTQITGILASGGLPVPKTSAIGPAAAAQAGLKAGARAASTVPSSAVAFTGQAFDACSAPSAATMAAWKADTTMPYGAIGIYIGGENEGCSQPNLTASWVATEAAAGWHFFLLYVGPQAPGSSCTSCSTISSPSGQGVSSAQDAAAQAAALGFGTGTPIVYDMEGYTQSTGTATVLSFMSWWTTELHALGYNSGEYSSLNSGITDLVNAASSYNEPDMIDFADWDGNASTTNPAIPTADWSTHQRIHQYSGGTEQTYGSVQIDVDQDYMDVAVPAPAPVLTSVQPAVLNSSSGALAVYTVRSDGNVWGDNQSSAGGAFGGWLPLSTAGDFTGTPTVMQAASGAVAIYARTTAGTVMGASQSVAGGAFSSWGQIGTASHLAGDPVALFAANGAVAIYATDSAGAVEGISQSVQYGPFGSWQTLSPAEGFTGRPSVLQTSGGLVAIYARTTAGTLLATSQHVRFGPFDPWSQIGSAAGLTSDPVALIAANGAVAIYATDSTGTVQGISQSVQYGPFGSWQTLSPADGFTGRPAVLMTAGGLVAMYARTTAGTLLATSQNTRFGPFSPWSQIGTATNLASDPHALITSAGTVAIFAADSSGKDSWISQSMASGPFGSWTEL